MADPYPVRRDDTDVPVPAAGVPCWREGWWRWLVVAAYLALVFSMSAQSQVVQLPGSQGDKVGHVAAYGLMGVLVVWAMVRGQWQRITGRTVLLATLFCTLYGYTDEVHQLFVPERRYDLFDLLADATGAFLAAAASWAWGIIARGGLQAHDV